MNVVTSSDCIVYACLLNYDEVRELELICVILDKYNISSV